MVLVKWREGNAASNMTAESIAEEVYVHWSAQYDRKKLVSKVKAIIDDGFRYKKIDREIGDGGFLVLGTV